MFKNESSYMLVYVYVFNVYLKDKEKVIKLNYKIYTTVWIPQMSCYGTVGADSGSPMLGENVGW